MSSVTLPGTGEKVDTVTYQDPDEGPVKRQIIDIGDLKAVIELMLEILANPIWIDQATGRQRAVIEGSLPAGANTIGAVNIAAAQTLATVTTLATLTNMAQVGAVPANSTIFDLMYSNWANSIRGRIA